MQHFSVYKEFQYHRTKHSRSRVQVDLTAFGFLLRNIKAPNAFYVAVAVALAVCRTGHKELRESGVACPRQWLSPAQWWHCQGF